MAEISIILISHGFYAQEALKSTEMILGYPQEQCHVISVTEGRSYDECLEELNNLYDSIDHEEGILILTDIDGGTPTNISTYLTLTKENIQVYSGFNLPILLELFVSRSGKSIYQLKHLIEATYKKSCVNITEKAKEDFTDGNQIDSY